MALALIDGTNAAIAVSINNTVYTCVFNYWSADLSREFTEATTFCNTGWRSRTPGMRQLNFRCDGYASQGAAQSDPSLTFSSQASVPIILTAATNCTFTFNGFISRSHTGLRAAANSEFSLEGESSGTVTTAWVVA